MKSPVCDMLGIEFPLFAFSHCRDVVAAVSRAGNARARDLVSYFVGQGVGLIDSVKSAGAVVQEFKEDFAEAVEHLNALVGE